MYVEELESISRKSPEREINFWSDICNFDDYSCPFDSCCQTKKTGGWCFFDNKECFRMLLDSSQLLFDSYNFIENQSKKSCQISQILEKMAHEYTEKYLEATAVAQPPLPTEIINWIDTRHDVEIRELPLKVYHGAMWYDDLDNEWVIQIRKTDSPIVKRYTLFHEAFHILSHNKTPSVVKREGAALNSLNEFMADYFAICISMPREWVKNIWAEVKDLDKMAEIFAIPRSAMFIRLRQMGLL